MQSDFPVFQSHGSEHLPGNGTRKIYPHPDDHYSEVGCACPTLLHPRCTQACVQECTRACMQLRLRLPGSASPAVEPPPARPFRAYLRRARQASKQLYHVLLAMPGAKASIRTCLGLSHPHRDREEIEQLRLVPSVTPDAMPSNHACFGPSHLRRFQKGSMRFRHVPIVMLRTTALTRPCSELLRPCQTGERHEQVLHVQTGIRKTTRTYFRTYLS